MKLVKDEQNELMRLIDDVLYQHEQRNEAAPNILLLDVLSWHKLQSLPEIEENTALIDGMKRGKYKGVDVLLVTDPFFGMHGRSPLGVVIMAGKRV